MLAKSVLAATLLIISGHDAVTAEQPRSASGLLDAASLAHGGKWRSGQIQNWTCEGTIVFYSEGSPANEFTFRLMRRGADAVQRIIVQTGAEIRQGSDGKRSWNAAGPFFATTTGSVSDFIESQTGRSVQAALNYHSNSLEVRDLGNRRDKRSKNKEKNARVIEAEDARGKKTRYLVDEQTLLITALEFDVGVQTNLLDGTGVALDEHYAFSDFRNVDGIQTPFVIERYRGEVKVEEVRLKAVTYNTNMPESVFQP
jgi:hypothetical protein